MVLRRWCSMYRAQRVDSDAKLLRDAGRSDLTLFMCWFAPSSQFILLVIYPLVPVVTRLFFFAGYDKLDETKLKKGRARPAHCQSSNATYGFTRLFAVGLWKNTFVSLLHSMAASVLSTWAVYKNTLGAPDLLAVRCQLWHATRRPC